MCDAKGHINGSYLGNRYQTKIEHVGVDRGIPADQTLIL